MNESLPIVTRKRSKETNEEYMNESLPLVFADPLALTKLISATVEKHKNFNIALDKISMITPNPAQLFLAVSLSQHVLREASDCFVKVF
jgi:hypothetical protein